MRAKGTLLTKLLGITLLIITALPLINCDDNTPAPPQVPDNNCTCSQYDLVCTEGVSTCWHVDCQRTDYKDGKCFLYGPGTIPDIPEPLRGKAIDMVNLYFDAYADAVKAGGGKPNQELIEKAKKSDPEEIMSNVLLGMTNDFLYIALGNDMKALTLNGPWGDCEIAAVKNKTQTLALVNAVKAGTEASIKSGNADAIRGPIVKFFQDNHDYKPVYPGYCYSENIKQTPAECIAGALEKRLSLLTDG